MASDNPGKHGCEMNRTRLSLYYLVSYLTVAGLGFLLLPRVTLSLLLSNGNYGDVFPRLAGMSFLGIALIVAQLIRKRVEVMYSTTLLVRVFFLVVLAPLFVASRDPAFLIIFVIVAVGVFLTGYAFFTERRRAAG